MSDRELVAEQYDERRKVEWDNLIYGVSYAIHHADGTITHVPHGDATRPVVDAAPPGWSDDEVDSTAALDPEPHSDSPLYRF